MRLLKILLLTVAALVATTAPAAAQSAVSTPSARTLYRNGPSGRFLMDGTWLFRLDNEDRGLAARYMRETGSAGWTPTTVPNAWNATDQSPASFQGGVG